MIVVASQVPKGVLPSVKQASKFEIWSKFRRMRGIHIQALQNAD